VGVYVCVYVGVYVCVYVGVYVCVYVGVYVCVYVGVYVCVPCGAVKELIEKSTSHTIASLSLVCYTRSMCGLCTFIHMCDMTNSYVWHGSFVCVVALIHVWDMAHLCVSHDVL